MNEVSHELAASYASGSVTNLWGHRFQCNAVTAASCVFMSPECLNECHVTVVGGVNVLYLRAFCVTLLTRSLVTVDQLLVRHRTPTD